MSGKRLVFQAYVGERRPLWDKCVASVVRYCARHGFVHHIHLEPVLNIVPRNSQRSATALKNGILPIFEKFTSFDLLKEWDEILVLDCDVWIHPDAGNIFDAVPPEYDFAACVERHMPITPAYARKLDRYALGHYGDSMHPFMNMGVRLIRRSLLPYLNGETPMQFIHRPEFADFVNGVGHYRTATEQTLLNRWLERCGAKVFHLSAVWNVLYGAVVMPDAAQFVHFFLSEHLTSTDPLEMLRTGTARPRV